MSQTITVSAKDSNPNVVMVNRALRAIERVLGNVCHKANLSAHRLAGNDASASDNVAYVSDEDLESVLRISLYAQQDSAADWVKQELAHRILDLSQWLSVDVLSYLLQHYHEVCGLLRLTPLTTERETDDVAFPDAYYQAVVQFSRMETGAVHYYLPYASDAYIAEFLPQGTICYGFETNPRLRAYAEVRLHTCGLEAHLTEAQQRPTWAFALQNGGKLQPATTIAFCAISQLSGARTEEQMNYLIELNQQCCQTPKPSHKIYLLMPHAGTNEQALWQDFRKEVMASRDRAVTYLKLSIDDSLNAAYGLCELGRYIEGIGSIVMFRASKNWLSTLDSLSHLYRFMERVRKAPITLRSCFSRQFTGDYIVAHQLETACVFRKDKTSSERFEWRVDEACSWDIDDYLKQLHP